MSNRFTDNVTPLNAATLNQFEDDLKQYKGIPIYNAIFENEMDGFRNYRISDIDWENIPLGSYFSIKLSSNTSGNSNSWITLKFGTSPSGGVICCNTLDEPSLEVLMRVNNRKFLLANVPYLIKKNNKSLVNIGIVLVEQYDTSKLGTALGIDGNSIYLKNMDGTLISNISLDNVAENIGAEIPGRLKIGSTNYTLRTGTSGAAGYITFVLE